MNDQDRSRPREIDGAVGTTGSSGEDIRRRNLAHVLRLVHAEGSVARSELTARTALNRSTVRSLVRLLHVQGLVEEVPPERNGAPGRPSTRVVPHSQGPMALAIDIEVDSLAVGLLALGGDMIAAERVDRGRDRMGWAPTLADIQALVEAVLAAELGQRQLIGVGVAIVGTVRRRDGLVRVAPNLRWSDVPLATMIDEQLGLGLPVTVGNEADLGARAEQLRGSGRGRDDLLYLSGEVGVGAGLIIGGEPYSGGAGYGGEVGHMCVNPLGVACRCGSRGCWETEIGEAAILRHAGGGGAAGGRPAIEEFLAAAARGESAALQSLEIVGGWLGLGLANVCNIINPTCVVLGGLLSEILPYVREVLDRELRRRVVAGSRDVLQVLPAALGLDAQLIGAGELALAPLLDDPLSLLPVTAPA